MELHAHAKSLDLTHGAIAERMTALGYPVGRTGVSRYLLGDVEVPEKALPMLAAALRVPASTIHIETTDDEAEDADEESDLPKASGL